MMEGYFEDGVRHAFTLTTLLNYGEGNLPITQIDEFWDYLEEDVENWATQHSAVFMPSHAIESLKGRVEKSVEKLASYFQQCLFYNLPKGAMLNMHLTHYDATRNCMIVAMMDNDENDGF